MSQSELDRQVGGNHYKGLAIQVIEWADRNSLSFNEGNIVKYLTRWRKKNGVQDVEKAIHYYKVLLELYQDGSLSKDHLTFLQGKPLWKLHDFLDQFPELTSVELYIINGVTSWRRGTQPGVSLECLEPLFHALLDIAQSYSKEGPNA